MAKPVKKQRIHPSVYVAPTASIVGDVAIGHEVLEMALRVAALERGLSECQGFVLLRPERFKQLRREAAAHDRATSILVTLKCLGVAGVTEVEALQVALQCCSKTCKDFV